MKRKSPPDDRIRLFERLVKAPANAGEDFVDKIPTSLALYILELAKRAPEPHSGRTKKTGRVKVTEALIITGARARKRKLEANGLTAEEALQQATEEAAKRLPLAVSTIRRRMQRKPSRR